MFTNKCELTELCDKAWSASASRLLRPRSQGLGLSRGYGVRIADVLPGSPADAAGLRPRDIITTVDSAELGLASSKHHLQRELR
jgi:S1-C subfamily serine protease